MDDSRVIEELRGIIGDVEMESRLRGNRYTPSDAERLDNVYKAVFGRRITRTCGNCLYDAYILLKINAKKDFKNMEERIKCGFALKAGAILRVDDGKGGRTLYGNDNLTDAVARKWLTEHPNTRHYFAAVPAGFDEELAAGMKAAAEPATASEEDTEAEQDAVPEVKPKRAAGSSRKNVKRRR